MNLWGGSIGRENLIAFQYAAKADAINVLLEKMGLGYVELKTQKRYFLNRAVGPRETETLRLFNVAQGKGKSAADNGYGDFVKRQIFQRLARYKL